MGSASFYRGQTAEKEISELRDRGYAVEYINRDLSDSEMARLYAGPRASVRRSGAAKAGTEARPTDIPFRADRTQWW